MSSKVMSVTEVASHWGMDEHAIYEMARRRILIALQADTATYISRAHVEQLEDNGMTDLSREHLVTD
jgi:hypothetical protein